VGIARSSGGVAAGTRVADAQHLDLAPGSFDAAISRNCLMLIPDYRRALAEIRRVLKPGGRFAAMVYSTRTAARTSRSPTPSRFGWVA
jgi:ubiquinone/menaquinone biosynthesis C-methylase UbiE